MVDTSKSPQIVVNLCKKIVEWKLTKTIEEAENLFNPIIAYMKRHKTPRFANSDFKYLDPRIMCDLFYYSLTDRENGIFKKIIELNSENDDIKQQIDDFFKENNI